MSDSVSELANADAASSVPHAVFNVAETMEKERYDLWQSSISCIFEVEAHREERRDDFQAEVDANMFGPLMLARTKSQNQKWSRSPALMGRDGMDHYMVQLFEQGRLNWGTRQGEFVLPENSLLVFDLTQEVISHSERFTNLSLIIPRAMLEGQIKSPDDQHLRILSGNEPMVQLLRDHMLSLKRLSTQMTARQAMEVAPATVGLTAACLNAAISDRPDQQGGVALAQMTMVRRLIEQNLPRPELRADWIAKHAHISRTKLYEMFEGLGGVANYVRERRLRRALLALGNRNARHRSIYDIALDAGYASDTAFTRAFRAHYGMTPRDVRQAGVTDSITQTGQQGPDRRYERWLHHLSV